MSPTPPLFLASIGNPPPRWHKTLHSAGHILLRILSQHLKAPLQPVSPYSIPSHPPPRDYPGPYTAGAKLPNTDTHLTLWQSPTLMNVSGPTLVRTYEKWCARRGGRGPIVGAVANASANASANITNPDRQKDNARDESNPIPLNLILLHDDLELSPGKLSVRRGGASLSARGHNGIKSVVNSLVKAGMLASTRGAGKKKGAGVGMGGILGAGLSASAVDPTRFQLTRIGVGIGRPASREPADVAEYVLGRMPDRQVEVTEGLVGKLVEILEKEAEMIRGR
ncbi:hypothetical protein PAAG_07343 [Paracoccidioides lutzii Pb01]|uniref:peptidyl-tRNA hydrolase n=1 Tax=Paracoccidioides lutzii (strain ATCC MYA-826 / Pb01) TaxID=502779 RepID=C1H9A2_PARBA|nr:hypothetical protein PAAG_07343 [Paracoccidioides lutzii Pb01]EEH36925.1 hypothetical protein PAAG_07343 [Paracoccidioides lutzii Pb01]